MLEENAFASFLQRIRAGDDQAAVELVQQFEPLIRTEVRMRLSDPRLYRLFDSMDICQSVLASFFVRAAVGQYDLTNSQQSRLFPTPGSATTPTSRPRPPAASASASSSTQIGRASCRERV